MTGYNLGMKVRLTPAESHVLGELARMGGPVSRGLMARSQIRTCVRLERRAMVLLNEKTGEFRISSEGKKQAKIHGLNLELVS